MSNTSDIQKSCGQLPQGQIPDGWEIRQLRKVCDFLDSYRIPLKDADRVKIRGEYPYYGASGIIDYINDFIFDEDLILLAEDGANIVNRSTPLAFLINGKVWVNNHAHVLRVHKDISRYYVCAYLESLNYEKYNTGTAQPKLNREVCESIPVLLPPEIEQIKIAEVLSTWDKAIELQKAIIDKLTLRKKGLMQQLLTGKKRLKGFSEPWRLLALGCLSERITRKNMARCSNVVTVSAQQGFVKQTDFFEKTIASDNTDNYYLVKRDEFCYNKSYSMGYPMGAIKRLKDFDEAVVTTLYIVFRAKETELKLEFFEQYCECGLINKGLLKVANEGGRAHGLLNVTPKDFFNLNVMIPDISEQKAIAGVLVYADNEIEKEKQKLAALKQQKKGLMQQLLTGKKRVVV